MFKNPELIWSNFRGNSVGTRDYTLEVLDNLGSLGSFSTRYLAL